MNRSLNTVLSLFNAFFCTRNQDDSLAIVIFTKDRPLQLDALLRSLKAHWNPLPDTTVIWKATDSRMRSAYCEVFSANDPKLKPREEKSFRSDLLEVLTVSAVSRLMFLVDDILFVRPFDPSWLKEVNLRKVVPSLRLDPKVTYSQPHQCDSPPPPLRHSKHAPWLTFSWVKSNEGWSMPHALDGNIFHRKEVLALLKRVDFRSPNSLEYALGAYRFWFKFRMGYCLPDRCILNFALNRVQTENQTFPCGEYSATTLLEKWNDGWRLNIDEMAQIQSNSTHTECQPVFERRK